MKKIIIWALAILLVVIACGDMNPLGHHRPGHGGGGDDNCPPGHERRGLCEVAPEPEPEPDPVVVDSLTFDPPSLSVEIDDEVEFYLALWSDDIPHFCVVLNGEPGLLEAYRGESYWYWVEGAEHKPYPCDGMEVKAVNVDIGEIIWSPHYMDNLSLVQLRVPPSGRVAA